MLNRNTYPLSASQQIILMQQQSSMDKSISNINVMVHFEDEVDDDLMLQALSMALLRNKSASFQIREIGKNNYEQYFSVVTPQPIEIVDFSDASEEELKSYLKKEGTTAFPNKSFDTPLYKIKYIIKPDEKRGIYFVVSHMILDAFALIFMTEDAFTIYEALRDGRPLPKPFLSGLSLLNKEREYLESSECKRDLNFWDEVFKDEPLYNSLLPAGSKDYDRNKRTGNQTYIGLKNKSDSWIGKIPAEFVEKTAKFAKKHEEIGRAHV